MTHMMHKHVSMASSSMSSDSATMSAMMSSMIMSMSSMAMSSSMETSSMEMSSIEELHDMSMMDMDSNPGMHSGHMHGDLSMAGNSSHPGFMMMMFFHTAVSDYFLFEQWQLSHAWQMIIACIGVFLLAVVQEALKVLRQQLHSRMHRSRNRRLSGENSLLHSSQDMQTEVLSYKQRLFSRSNVLQTVLYLIYVILGYIVMLSVMTLSVWLFLSAVLGLAFGFFLFNNLGSSSVKLELGDHCVWQ